MANIKLKRVYTDYDAQDGFRVLVDKLWPRGIKKEYLKMDEWNKNIAPSTALREWFHQDPENRWAEFSSHYLRELENSLEASEFINEIKGYETVTLLFASKDLVHNHAIILKQFLDKQLNN